jgi:two-component sensor histidine kinase
VVNDFSLVHALLGMAMRKTTDERAARLFQASRNRVRVIALLHAVAWRTENGAPGAPELRTYLEEVLREAERARATHGRLRVELDSGGVALAVSEMAAIGLCVSELAHNALAHAFPGDRRGLVRVTLERCAGSNDVLLRVTDDGVGMPADATQASAGLGLALVRLLAEQLSGRLTCGSNEGNGTDFCLRFSNPEESRVWPTS